MDAGLLSDSGPQQPVSLDGGVGITLGSDGQVQIDDNDGSLSHPESADITPSDDNQVPTTANSPLETNLITQFSSELFTSFQEAASTNVQPYPTSEVGYTTPTNTAIPPYSLGLTSLPSIVPSELPNTASFTISQSPTPSEFPSSIQTSFSWTSWATSQSFSVSSSSISPSTTMPNYSSPVTSLVGSVTTSIASGLSTVVSSLSSHSISQSSSQSVSASNTASQRIPSETILAAPTLANFNVHSPTFYVGVAIGTVISIGLIAAFIAWWIRLRSRRRRRARTMVPWGRSGYGDGGGLEAGYSSIDANAAAIGALNLGSREDLAHAQAWSPGGDRDVGEPKRAEAYFSGPFYGLSDQRIARRDYHVDFLNDPPYPTRRPGSTQIRHLPSHLLADDIVARHQRGALNGELSNYPKRPQDAFFSGNYHNYGGVTDEGQLPHMPRSMAERLRNLGKPTAEPPGGEPGPLPSPEGPRLGNEELEAWGHSFKTNLVNAFNAVAANLGAGAPRMNEDDKLSAPPRRSTRKSIKSVYRERDQMDEKKIVRNGSILTTASKPWTLEETADGVGIVHLHIRELEVTNPDVRPPMPLQTLSFGDGDSFSACDGLDKGHHPVRTGETRVPLVASSKPQQAFIRPNPSPARQKSTDTVNGNTLSRRSSVYSMMSARSGAFNRGHISKLYPPRSGTGNRLKPDVTNEEDTVVIQPDTISRLSSSDSSILPGGGARSSVDEIASRALKIRQNRINL